MFAPSELLDLVDALRSAKADGPVDRRFRTSISRAYYAAFLTVREQLRILRADPAYDVEHRSLARWLEHDHKADLVVANFGRELRVLFEQRVKSDYDLSTTLSFALEDLYLKSARSLISRAPSVLKLVDPRRAPMKSRGY